MQEFIKDGTGGTWLLALACVPCGRLEFARLRGYTRREAEAFVERLRSDERCAGCEEEFSCRLLPAPR
jgi:hypothetical protein